jgi:diacylglycerol kinase (ATP)
VSLGVRVNEGQSDKEDPPTEQLGRFRASLPARGEGPDVAARPQVQIIVTPGSGDGHAVDTAQRLQQALATGGWKADISTFATLGSLVRWARTCDAGFSHLVCVGGDSTQSVAAGAAVRLGVPLIPVPNGFGNMFAAAFGHRDAPEAVRRLLERGRTCRIDVGQAGHELFLSHRSYGPLQQIEEAVERSRNQLRTRLLRSLAYYLMAGRYLVGAALPSIRVEVDGSLLTGNAVMVTVANVETYRGFLSLTPAAVPTDGLFDVFAMPRTTRLDLWMGLLRLWRHSSHGGDGILRCRGRHVRVAVNGAAPEEIHVLPGALRILVPRHVEMPGPSFIGRRGRRGGRQRARAAPPRKPARGRRGPLRPGLSAGGTRVRTRCVRGRAAPSQEGSAPLPSPAGRPAPRHPRRKRRWP